MTHGLDTSVVVASELAGHTRHEASRMLLECLSREGGTVALAPQVLAEFVHIVTDPRRWVRETGTPSLSPPGNGHSQLLESL